MDVKYWTVKTIKVFVSIFVVLLIIYLLEGYETPDAFGSALLWSLLSTVAFVGSQIYKARKGKACAVCDDD
jgi:hypothetical protein